MASNKMEKEPVQQPLLVDGQIRSENSRGSSSPKSNGRNLRCGGQSCSWADQDTVQRSEDMKKLSRAVAFCLCFMIVEVVGGIKAGSLAILTDAAHLLSDVASFAISLFAIWAGGWEANLRQTFGFYRLEILGALVSIMIIWLITGIIVYEAFVRLLKDTVEIDGRLMFIIASLGLVVNLVMMFLLDHGHDHGHDHGTGNRHLHEHSHGDEHERSNQEHRHEEQRDGHEYVHSPYDSHHHHRHDDHSRHEGDEHDHHSDQDHHHDNDSRHEGGKHDRHSDHEHHHSEAHLENDRQVLQTDSNNHRVDHGAAAVALQQEGHKTECVRDNISKGRRSTTGDTIIVCICDEIDGQQSRSSGLAERSVRVTIDHGDHKSGHGGEDKSINVRGAYLHVLGDLIQSVGVMIGGAIIWYNPAWKIVDLICTFFFSFLVLGTTIKMLRDILEVLMESTPRQVDAGALQSGLVEIDGVIAVHELHIWAITVGKVLLACHVTIEPNADADDVLQEVIQYCDKKFKISHVTIQIERSKP